RCDWGVTPRSARTLADRYSGCGIRNRSDGTSRTVLRRTPVGDLLKTYALLQPNFRSESLAGNFTYAPAGARCCLARPTNCSNPVASLMAISDKTFRSKRILAFFRALINRPYVSPCARTAALMRAIHNTRKSRFLFFRP